MPHPPRSNPAPAPIDYFGVVPQMVMHIPGEPAGDSGDPLDADPVGRTFVSWDGFVICGAALASRTGSFGEGPQKTELGPGHPWALKRSWLKL